MQVFNYHTDEVQKQRSKSSDWDGTYLFLKGFQWHELKQLQGTELSNPLSSYVLFVKLFLLLTFQNLRLRK